MKTYAFDTNIVSHFLRNNQKIIQRVKTENANGSIIKIPPTVFFETRRGLVYLNAVKKLRLFEKLYQKNGIDIITQKILEKAGDIYVQLKNHKPTSITVGDGDLLIAAHCLQNDCVLVTTNTKHFENIENLQIENWME